MKQEAHWYKDKEIWVSLLLLLTLTGLAYLPLMGTLGFYNDDWHLVASQTSGVSIYRMFLVDRPAVGLSYQIFGTFLGDHPLNWHLAAFALRLVCGLMAFWLLRMLWPERKLANTLLAALMNIYPGYLQQPAALTYFNHFLSFGAALFSLAVTVFILKGNNRLIWKILLGVLAVIATLGYLAMDEFMIGLEGARLALAFYVLSGQSISAISKRVRQALVISLPNLLAVGVFLYWRFFIFNSARPTTNADLLFTQYLRDPLNAFLRLVLETGRDFFEVTIQAWFVPLYQTTQRLSYSDLAWAIFLGLIGGVAVWVYVRLIKLGKPNYGCNNAEAKCWEVFTLGAVITLLAVFPVILAGRDVQFGNGFDRYTLHATLGVAVMLLGLVSLLREKAGIFTLGILVGISLITQYSNAVYYRTFWEVQRQLWWQLSWRAPGIYGDTVLITSLPEGYRIMEDYQVWAPANLIFSSEPLAIGAEVLNDDTAVHIVHGDTVNRQFRNIAYKREFRLSLLLSMTEPGACLHVLDGEVLELPAGEVPLVRLVAPYSDITRINSQGPGFTPPEEVFGTEPVHDWCYYYQRESLARQAGDWIQVAELGDEALSLDLYVADPSEWMPYLESLVQMNRLEDAASIAARIQLNPMVTRQICERFSEGQEPPAYFSSAETFAQTGELLCP